MGWLGIFLTGPKYIYIYIWSNKCNKFKWSKNVIGGETVTIPKKLSRNVRDVKVSTNTHNSCLWMINNSSYCLQVKKNKQEGTKNRELLVIATAIIISTNNHRLEATL